MRIVLVRVYICGEHRTSSEAKSQHRPSPQILQLSLAPSLSTTLYPGVSFPILLWEERVKSIFSELSSLCSGSSFRPVLRSIQFLEPSLSHLPF